ncbi:hypothetical protein ACIA5C_40060 [Actinoplanes sp. NPDC051343]|uniref:hypothetical protein n=1 Tax=Actinoplanes sp. NPDC051343 TaxID=3363906 RepID=UPI003787D25E
MTRLRGTLIAAAVPLVVLLGACAQQTAAGSPTGTPGSSGTPESAAAKSPAANDLVLRTETYGGFVAPDMVLGRFPQISVYGDGRVISEGPVPAIYPGPALPNIQVSMITPELVRQLVKEGLAAGVRNGSDLGQPGVADAPSTRVTVVTAGGKQVVTINALTEAPSNDRRLTADQRSTRAKIAAYVKKLGALPKNPVAYQPTAVVVFAAPWTEPANGPVPPAKAWPGPALPGTDIDSATRAGCLAVTGDQTPKVLTAARSANALTPWTTGSSKWRIVFRPLLPDENGCAAVKATR